jgi:signal transduction histidine kinase
MDYHIETVTLFPVFERVKELYSIVALHQQTVLSVAVEPSTLKVRADAERLQQVIANLVSNVLKFTPAGGKVTIAAQLTEHKVIIRVSDTGKGIAKEVIKTLFKRFTQSDIAAQRSNRIQGTGLGLYIVAETLEAMGANIRLESAIGQGTQAIIEFSCVS